VGVTAHGGLGFTKIEAFCFPLRCFPLRCLFSCSTCRPEALRWMTTHFSDTGVRPTWPPCCSLVFAISAYKVLLFASVGPESPGTQLQRGHGHSRWQVELNQIVNKPERRDGKTTQVLERKQQCASGCYAQSSPGRAPVCEVKSRLTVLSLLHKAWRGSVCDSNFLAKSFLQTLVLARNNFFAYQSTSLTDVEPLPLLRSCLQSDT